MVISDPRSLIWRASIAKEPMSPFWSRNLVDLLMDHDPNDVRPLILIHITPKERTHRPLRSCYLVGHARLLYADNFLQVGRESVA